MVLLAVAHEHPGSLCEYKLEMIFQNFVISPQRFRPFISMHSVIVDFIRFVSTSTSSPTQLCNERRCSSVELAIVKDNNKKKTVIQYIVSAMAMIYDPKYHTHTHTHGIVVTATAHTCTNSMASLHIVRSYKQHSNTQVRYYCFFFLSSELV